MSATLQNLADQSEFKLSWNQVGVLFDIAALNGWNNLLARGLPDGSIYVCDKAAGDLAKALDGITKEHAKHWAPAMRPNEILKLIEDCKEFLGKGEVVISD